MLKNIESFVSSLFRNIATYLALSLGKSLAMNPSTRGQSIPKGRWGWRATISQSLEVQTLGPRSHATWHKERKKKNYARTMYRHDCELIVQMLNTADRVVT
jgi:hypothetical protein